VIAGIAIYGSMLSVYWGSQFVSSGFISVIFGLNPIMTGIMAALWLNERSLTPARVLGVFCGIAGLIVIFGQGMHLGEKAAMGIGAIFIAVILHSLSSVMFKKLDVELNALEITHGGLLVSVPLYLFTWFALQGTWPEHITARSVAAIFYLGAFGSVLGFMMFFYILKRIEASRVALITLVTPVVALYLGYALNNETLNSHILFGTGLILLGMTFYYWSDKRVKAVYAE
jgi:drug/metabolite transporter (DMT)-like permease